MGRPAVPGKLGLHQLPGQVLTEEDLEGEHWYDCAPEWPSEAEDGPRAPVEDWKVVAEAALSSATRAYEKQTGGGSNAGKRAPGKEQTIGDRIASLTLRVQESPFHRLDDLRTLQALTKKKERRESAPAAEALKDLFINDLLPPDRRLIRFEDREFECGKKGGISKRNIAYALYEAELKTVYRDFLRALEEFGRDNLSHFKQRAVKYIAELLIAKPECEKELLAMLVNKLGDPDRKVSSTASFNLRQLIEKHHPKMRSVVVKEVEQLLMRPNVTKKAQYFAVIFLNQIQFTAEDVELARWMLRIYMNLFTSSLLKEKQSPELSNGGKEKAKHKSKRKRKPKASAPRKDATSEVKDSRLMGALLIGANRAYPYTKPEQDEASYQDHYNSLFEVAHSNSLEPATQALAFLFQVSQSHSTQGDRFYRALYSRIYDAAGAGEPKQASFLNLLYKAMKADTNPRRVKAFVKRLLQAAAGSNSSFGGACAVVLSECFRGKQFGVLKSFIILAELSDEAERFIDADKQASEHGNGLQQPQSYNDGQDMDESEMDLDDAPSKKLPTQEGNATGSVATGSVATGSIATEPAKSFDEPHYNPAKRNPEFAGAETSRLWELVALCYHFHPSVSKFARSMCVQLKNFQYPGDPLKDFSLIAFLDKFAYKKPKNRIAKSLYGKRASSYRDDPLPNSWEFQELASAGNVAEDDKFFIRFFNANPSRVVGQTADGADGAPAEGEGENTSESEEEAFEQAMQAEMRRLGADAGFSSAGIHSAVADVDEEDEDEVREFEKAFASDLIQSDAGEGDANAAQDGKEPMRKGEKPVQTAVRRVGNAKGSKQHKRGKSLKHKPSKETGFEHDSVFAAAEDYAEAIEVDARKREANESGGQHEDVTTQKRASRKRIRPDTQEKPRKKGRRKHR